MTLIVDASVAVTAVVEGDEWAREQLAATDCLAPHLMPGEVASGLRRLVATGRLTAADAEMMLADVLTLPIELYPFEPFADRVWELRDNLTPYDAWYVALAEAHEAPLATLDRRLVEAPGPRCEFLTP